MSADKFKFTHDDVEYEIPSFKSLPAGVIRKSRKGTDDVDKAFLILESTLGEDSTELAAVDAMSISEFNDFVTAWTKGATLGESSGS